MKLFLDTNFLLRYFLQDEKDQFEYCKNLILRLEEGEFQAYTSSIVFLEITYVLKSVYGLPFLEIVDILDAVLGIRGITVLDKTDIKKALKYFKKYKIKFSDCLIASQLPQKSILISFDMELSKIKEITVKQPQELSI